MRIGIALVGDPHAEEAGIRLEEARGPRRPPRRLAREHRRDDDVRVVVGDVFDVARRETDYGPEIRQRRPQRLGANTWHAGRGDPEAALGPKGREMDAPTERRIRVDEFEGRRRPGPQKADSMALQRAFLAINSVGQSIQ